MRNVLSAKYNAVMNPSDIARALGRRGGRERAARLPAEDRKRIASIGGRARRESLQAARRITSNFQYLAVILALHPPPPLTRRRGFRGRLPGIYPPRQTNG